MFSTVISLLFESFIDCVHYISKIPLIKQLNKKSLMGYNVDKTWDYYMSTLEISPIDDEYYIKYTHKNNDYILVCDKDKINSAVRFIKSRCNIEPIDKIFFATEKNINHNNITEKVKMFAGPEQDFYINTDFFTKKKHITDYELYILYKNDNEFISIK